MTKKITPLGTEIDYTQYWKKRKKERMWCRLLINYDRLRELLHSKQFTLEHFCEMLFDSQKKSEIALKMIKHMKNTEKPVFFKGMVEELNVPRSTSWQVYLALKRAGVITRKTKAEPLKLSSSVSEILEELEMWWKNFVKIKL